MDLYLKLNESIFVENLWINYIIGQYLSIISYLSNHTEMFNLRNSRIIHIRIQNEKILVKYNYYYFLRSSIN